MTTFDPDRAWGLHPQVAVRPEPFGALLYHFDTRKLSFLKDRTLLDAVRALADHPTARQALGAIGLGGESATPYIGALGTLADSRMIVERER